MYERIPEFELGPRESAFLWGPRQTGKSTLLGQRFPQAPRYDLLLSDEFRRLTDAPHLLREECLVLARKPRQENAIVIVDEVQKVPDLLDEVHWLLENTSLRFVLCGSSARKLRRGRGNLLGGRALRYELHPVVSAEIPDFDLETALNTGALPPFYGAPNARKRLAAYVGDYLKEEIVAEALTRNVAHFSRFLEVAALANGEMVQFANVARECGVSAPTVRAYYQILEDTLLGRFVHAYQRRPKRRVILSPRFYLFDVGVVGSLARRGRVQIGSELFGRAFEHFVMMEITAHRSYSGLDYPVSYWRTASQLEVDFVLGEHAVAVEVKGTRSAQPHHLRGLHAIAEEYRFRRRILVSCDPRRRIADGGIEIVPWREFLAELWSGGVVS
jgi:predicted AAA+ superfamily ATPase